MASLHRVVGFALLAAAVHGAVLAQKGAAKVNPVEKVTELLEKLSTKIGASGKKEAAEYDKYACFCKEQADEKLYLIEKSTKKIAKLSAKMEKLSADIADLVAQITDLATKISGLESEIEAAVALRKTQHDSYLEKEADISGAIDALTRAIEAMKQSKSQMGGDTKMDLAQISLLAGRVLRTVARSQLAAASAARQGAVAVLSQLGRRPTTGVAADYEYKSNDIISTLNSLLADFKQNKKELDEAEFEENSAFEKNKLNLDNEKKFAEKDKAEKEAQSDALSEELAAVTADHDQEVHDKNADQSFLDELTSECQTKAEQWDQRSKMRSGELTAISEALESLKTSSDKYSANEQLTGLQMDAKAQDAVSFLQLRGARRVEASSKVTAARILQLLSSEAMRLKSPVLSAVMLRVQVAADHFVKVRQLIKDLMGKLKKDAEEEADQKSMCDKRMSAAVDSRDEANAGIEKQTALLSKLNSEEASLEQAIADDRQEIAENTKALNEATQLRNTEKEENEQTIEDAISGAASTDLALNVLNEFYSKAGSSLVQYVPPNSDREGKTVADRAPDTFDGTYHGEQGASKGIIGLLDVILSDFQGTIAKTANDEHYAQEDFDQMEAFITEQVEGLEAGVKKAQDRISELEDEKVDAETDLKSGQDLLASAKDELEVLQPMCVEGEESYAERVAKRENEIQALKDAMNILDNWQN